MAGAASELTPDEVFQHDPAGLAICDEIRRVVVRLDGVEDVDDQVNG